MGREGVSLTHRGLLALLVSGDDEREGAGHRIAERARAFDARVGGGVVLVLWRRLYFLSISDRSTTIHVHSSIGLIVKAEMMKSGWKETHVFALVVHHMGVSQSSERSQKE